MQIRLVDGIGPFFDGLPRRRRNWSKLPFTDFEADDGLTAEGCERVYSRFTRFLECARDAGFNAVTLDDLAHLVIIDEYPDELRVRLTVWQALYSRIIALADTLGFSVYITTDVMFWNVTLKNIVDDKPEAIATFLSTAAREIFSRHSPVKGIILRIGESDAADVHGDFHSELSIRTPDEARRLLAKLLPVFEEMDRLLIVRTWSVGAYPIGDVMWNRRTFEAVFGDFINQHLVISLKYGESDFFRYLPLNRHFFRSGHRKIIELQARREYEGFGEFPSFVGWDYERYRRELYGARGVIGLQLWVQTGGWTHFSRLTYINRSSIWTELNAYVTLRIFVDGMSTECAVGAYATAHNIPTNHLMPFLTMLRLSDEVIKELLYLDDYASRKLFFRRLRMPPLLSVYWDQIIITDAMRKILNCFVHNGKTKIRQGYRALAKVREMQELARTHELPDDGLRFQYDTFELLAVAREYFFKPRDNTAERLSQLKANYKQRYPDRYRVHLKFKKAPLSITHLKPIFALCLRDQRGYRFTDWVLTIYLSRLARPLLRLVGNRLVPSSVRDTAMGLDAVFK